MFKIGDMVRNVAGNIVGVVVDCDGDTVYFEQSNGVEVDFPESSLVLESAFQAQHDTSVRGDADSHENDAVYESVMSNLYPAIIEKGRVCLANARRVPGVAEKSWEGLSSLQKLNLISQATEVPVKDWIESNRPGARTSLSKLQLSVLAPTGRKA